MDICDVADGYIQQSLRIELDKLRTESHATPHTVDGVTYCIDCGEEIPIERLKAIPGCCRCVDCQEDFDNQ